ncbi:MAG: glycosyltransferase [Lachnospiraceae bacterium]|nr:glycosyltransferase [Lachnospiraceae bacterium]
MSKVPVTVCMIAKDEEKHIEECLRHLKKYDMEIIVTDTGSTDRTREIAEKYADKVVDFAWVDDFAAARNYCASFASNNWILAIDCDEYVNSIDVNVLRILMQKYPRYTGVIRLKNLISRANGETGYVSDDVPRMYNKNYYHFTFPIHEQIRFKDPAKSEDAMDAFLIPMEVIHHGYALTGEDMEKKQQRNLELLRRAIELNPEDGYNYFQIGQSQFVLGDIDAAIEAYEKGMSLLDSTENLYVPEMIMSLAKAYRAKDRFPEALALMEKYNSTFDTAKFNYLYANLLKENDQVIKALMIYVKVTMMKDVDTLGENLLSCYANIIQLYEAMGNQQMVDIFTEKLRNCEKERERVLNS